MAASCRIAAVMLLFAAGARAQDFPSFVARVEAAPEAARPALVDSFLRAVPSVPFVERDTLAHFLYRGEASTVGVPGEHCGWDPRAFRMRRLSTTDLWYATRAFEADARVEYKLVVDGDWMLDPRNPRQAMGGYGPNSELPMPRSRPPADTARRPGVARGRLTDTLFASEALGNSRLVRVYTPAGYDSMTVACPLALVHDGSDYLAYARMDAILDNLIARRAVPPLIAVFVPPVDRESEYAGGSVDDFRAFITGELLPAIDARYRTRRDPAGRAVLGASNGGNIALYLALRHPDHFGCVAAQSSYVMPGIFALLGGGERLPLRFYLDLGAYDIPELIPLVRGLLPALRGGGYDLLYREHHEGHGWTAWAARVGDALTFFFGAPAR